jgi:hypothetical protein
MVIYLFLLHLSVGLSRHFNHSWLKIYSIWTWPISLSSIFLLGMVAYICNLSYLKGGGERIMVPGCPSLPLKKLPRTYLKEQSEYGGSSL